MDLLMSMLMLTLQADYADENGENARSEAIQSVTDIAHSMMTVLIAAMLIMKAVL